MATATVARADVLPPGLVSAELLPGYIDEHGTRVAALRLVLEPGWKTYWRSPGDSGIPPRFDWSAAGNLSSATPRWPVPEVIESGGERTLGYHDTLVLPIMITPVTPGQPVTLAATVDFGLCEDICVPAHVSLTTDIPPAATPDPRIVEALARVPEARADGPSCHLSEIQDGMRIAATLPPDAVPGAGDAAAGASSGPAGVRSGPALAIELAQDGVWVSEPELARDGDRVTATADLVAPSGKPFPVDPAKFLVTVIADGQGVEYQGCAGS